MCRTGVVQNTGHRFVGSHPSLCAGIPYVVTMTATHAAGKSAASAPSNPTVPLPAQAPNAPLISSVLSRDGGLVVNWVAPSILGGDPLKS